MTNSHLIGFATFGSFALFALLAWIVSYKHSKTAEKSGVRHRTRIIAIGLVVLGAVFGFMAFIIDNELRVTTLHEVMIPGSMGLALGTPAPIRTVRFRVEHPGVLHELFLSPVANTFEPPDFDVDISFALHGPTDQVLIPARTERFIVHSATRKARADWDGRSFPFTPSVTGEHIVFIRPKMTDIPRIQVRIMDPRKRNGKRMAGY